MSTPDRREIRGARARFDARGVSIAVFVGLAALLSSCQTTTVAPGETEDQAGAAAAEPARPQARTQPRAQRTSGVADAPPQERPGPPSSAPQDLIGRISKGLVLPPEQDAAIDREFDWYVANADYLNLVLNRSELYLYHITEALGQRGMPLDLALLPIVESAYDPFAYSKGQAAGLWQIIPGTGRELGLKQNWWYDARRDVLESTRAALDYLEQLRDQFDGDWLLAVAGYNAGGGSVARAVRRAEIAGERTDFWGIRPYLPIETRTYVPRLLALARLVAAPARYGVSFPVIADEPYFEIIDTGGQVDMALAARLAGMSSDELYRLNPGINRWASDPDGPHRLLAPIDKAVNLAEAVANPAGLPGVRWARHVVRAGETLSHLGVEYRTSAAMLREVNGLPGDMIRIGQDLMVPQLDADADAYVTSADALAARVQDQLQENRRQAYIVRSGDSLWSVSRRYGVELADLARWNSMAPEDVLSIGRELVVWSDSTVIVPDANHRIRRVVYTVREGDSLYRIATRFRVSIADLLQWNGLSPERYLQPGQRLTLFVDITEQNT